MVVLPVSVTKTDFFFQVEENARKRQQELDQQKVASQVVELKVAKLELEQEVDTHKKCLRMHIEAQVSLKTPPSWTI